MMYMNKMVVAVKAERKVLREQGETVFIPFGSEYALYLKNMNSVRARVDISIDGDDVLNGSSLVIDSNESLDLEGFLKGSDVSHKFKFIEKTQEISDFRGDKASDGLVRVSFKFEDKVPVYGGVEPIWYTPAEFRHSVDPYQQVYGNNTPDVTYGSNVEQVSSVMRSMKCHAMASQVMCSCNVTPENDSGITVKGSSSGQHFGSTTLGRMEMEEHVIILNLKGVTSQNQPVIIPVTVKTKIQCESCGKMWLAKQKFCGNCGTSLIM